MLPHAFSLPAIPPFDHAGVTRFLSAHAIVGVEAVVDGEYWRTLALQSGQALVAVRATPAGVTGRVWFRVGGAVPGHGSPGHPDLAEVVAAVGRLYDLDADAPAIDSVLGGVQELAGSLAAAPGIRMPGSTDPHETLFRTLIGQQVSVKAARTVQGNLAAALGDPLDPGLAAEATHAAAPASASPLSRLFPTAEQLARGGTGIVRGPAQRVRTILAVAEALAEGSLVVDGRASVPELMDGLEAMPGIGPWTAGYVAMRVLGAPDILLDGDLALRAGAAALGLPSERRELVSFAERVAPWRSYFGMHLWRDAVAAIAG
ncbi:DNA-3-methyladenine glycosylase family protein [Subtercola boreus]|uniref:DNA-3-methyladenine glycosylase family protein n=1 Tax=Subtercola boreus TaxID=120213 RepID=UPI0015594D25|nr:DNA-3-methyladenine glycosylase 2 family protein [Subtercola boreus]